MFRHVSQVIFMKWIKTYFFLCCAVNYGERSYHSFHVITQKGDTATAILQLSLLVYMPTRLRFCMYVEINT